MTSKRLAILGSRGIPARYGGFETFAEELAVRLVRNKISVTVFCEASDSDKATEQDHYCGIDLIHVRAPKLGPLSTILFDLKCLWRARRDFDVVYMLGYGASVFCFIPRLWGAAVWINMDGIEWARSKWSSIAKLYLRIMEAIAMRMATLIVADAVGIKQHLEDRYRSVPELAVIPYGADNVQAPPDVQTLAEWQLQPSKYYLVVCRLEPENHVLEIIEGFAASNSTMQLIVVGDIATKTPYVEQLMRIEDARVLYIGTIFDKDRLQSLRWHSRAYCHGHSVGGTNPSLLEALGCGNQVIAHDNPFNREVAQDCARYFESADDVKRAVESLEAEGVSEAVRARAQRRISEQYNWDAVADAYLLLLNNK